MQARRDDRSLGDLFGELTRDMTTLVRQEIALAKTEMTQKATAAGRQVAMLIGGGVVLYSAFLALLATITIALAYAMPWWLAALIVTVVTGAAGAMLVWLGLQKLRSMRLAPTQTVETLKEDATWMRQQAS
ncbi:MAG TPA: phage holin family protein [Ktedonobacterales bacterium]|jgi:threonine/homoserine/homoserine lactone efflux protein|nr:phage holin family protein [Ktedonobacterales bacterium]